MLRSKVHFQEVKCGNMIRTACRRWDTLAVRTSRLQHTKQYQEVTCKLCKKATSYRWIRKKK